MDLRQDESYGEKWRAGGKLIEQGRGNVKQPYVKNRSAKKRSIKWLRERYFKMMKRRWRIRTKKNDDMVAE